MNALYNSRLLKSYSCGTGSSWNTYNIVNGKGILVRITNNQNYNSHQKIIDGAQTTINADHFRAEVYRSSLGLYCYYQSTVYYIPL